MGEKGSSAVFVCYDVSATNFRPAAACVGGALVLPKLPKGFLVRQCDDRTREARGGLAPKAPQTQAEIVTWVLDARFVNGNGEEQHALGRRCECDELSACRSRALTVSDSWNGCKVQAMYW